jgi:hypothetical protein
VVGKAPANVYARLQDLGATLIAAPPDPLVSMMKWANKLIALKEPSDAPVLLVDNDICFLDDPVKLEGRKVRASVFGTAWVKDAEWAHIAAVTGLRPPALEWVSPQSQLEARLERRPPRSNHDLYLNGGVVWVRQPADFATIWARHMVSISEAFEGHPPNDRRLGRNDQLALSTAAAEFGGFDLLPLACNYRPICFRLGLPEPKFLHLPKLCRDLKRLRVSDLPLSRAVAAYWERLIVEPIKAENSASEVAVQLVDKALAIRDRVLRIVRDAGLDSFQFRST